jgi:hypothetical protein
MSWYAYQIMAFVHANALICEKVLVEKDEVASLVRVADVFLVDPRFVGNSGSGIPMYLWVQIRITQDDNEGHSLAFELVRPSGDKKYNKIADNQRVGSTLLFETTHKNFVAQGLVMVEPKEFGEHAFLIYFDDNVVTKVFFTLIAKPEIQSPPTNSLP